MIKLQVPFIFDREEFDVRVRIELYEGMEEEIQSLLDKAVPLLAPKAVYREIPVVNKTDGTVQIDDQIFCDTILVDRLNKVDKVFPYIVTCGDELEKMVNSSVDMLEVFWFDALKQMALDRAFNNLRSHIKSECSISKLYSLNPGSDACSEGWALSDQKMLFNLFPGVKEEIGVYLNDSMLMFPNKTISGVMFESDLDFVSCQECDNIHCPNRKMIHEGAIYGKKS